MKFKSLVHSGDCLWIASLAVFAACLFVGGRDASADVRVDAQRSIEEGVDHYERGDTRKALGAFGQAIGLDPANPLSFYNIGVLNYEDGNYRDAIEDFGTAVSMSPPGFADPMTNHGVTSAAIKGLEMAIIDYSNAIKIVPNDPDPYYNRGLAYQRLRDLGRAMATLVVNPSDGTQFDFSLIAKSREEQLRKAI